MRMRHGSLKWSMAWLCVVCVVAAACCAVGRAEGAEQCQAFLDALRAPECGYFDTALDYLDAMRTSPLADKDFRERIDFEVGVTMLGVSQKSPVEEREHYLEKAKSCFRKFLDEHPQSSLAVVAQRQLANVLVERGLIALEVAARQGRQSQERITLLTNARFYFQDAQTLLNSVCEQLYRTQKSMGRQTDADDTETVQRRLKIQGEIIVSRFTQSRMYYQIAQTYKPGSKENEENLKQAAKKYAEYYWKYEPRLGAFPFYIEDARCRWELGDYSKAMAILKELLDLRPGRNIAFRRILMPAVRLTLQIDMDPKQEKYEDAWAAYKTWEKHLKTGDDAEADVAAIQYFGGAAALEMARSISPKSANEKKMRVAYLNEAKTLLTLASKNSREFRSAARLKLSDPLLSAKKTADASFESFEIACERGKLAWEQLNDSRLDRERAARLRSNAISCFQFALSHQPFNAKLDDLNAIRYCLAYLYYREGKYHEAAVFGETLTLFDPNQNEAQQGAEIALGAYAKLCGEPLRAGEDHGFEIERMSQLAGYVADRWPSGHAADDAWMSMMRDYVAKLDVESAVQCINRIPTKSSRRGDIQLLLGQLLWNKYIELSNLPESQRPVRAKMQELSREARNNLEAAVAELRKDVEKGNRVTAPLAAGSLALAQAYMNQGNAEKAIAWLTDSKIGAYSLVEAKADVIRLGNYRVETLKSMLLAYVAAEKYESAGKVIELLEQGDAAAHVKLDLTLAHQFEESFKRFRVDGNQPEMVKAIRGYDYFLSRLAARPPAETGFNALRWVGESYANVAAALDHEEAKATAEALPYYEKASGIFQKIVDAAQADAKFVTRQGGLELVEISQTRCLRRVGKFDEAIQALFPALKTRNALLDVQREAAYTYQAWGETSPDRFATAIRGTLGQKSADGKPLPLVWGWSGIARKVQFLDTHQKTFHEARFNMAFCRMKLAQSKSGQEREMLLQQAAEDILVIKRLRPEMGGKKWYAEYDSLLRRIQSGLDVPESERGLAVAEKKMAAASK